MKAWALSSAGVMPRSIPVFHAPYPVESMPLRPSVLGVTFVHVTVAVVEDGAEAEKVAMGTLTGGVVVVAVTPCEMAGSAGELVGVPTTRADGLC